MAMRVGEMMVVIRAQDFASRTLRRVGGEFAGMSRDQQLLARRQQLMMRQFQQAQRIRGTMESGRNLQLLRQRVVLQDRLNKAEASPMLSKGFRSKAQEIKTFENALAGADAQIARAGPQWVRLNNVMKGSSTALRDLDTMLERNARSLSIQRGGIGPLRDQLNGINAAIRQLPIERLDRVAHALSGIGRTMQLFGAVGVAAFGLAANAAANFSTQMSLAATQARDIGGGAAQIQERLDQLSNGLHTSGQNVAGVLDLMNKYPATADQMSKATYDIFSSMDLENNGIINVAKGLGLLKDANKIAVAGGVDLNEATSAMITVLNNFDPTLQNVNKQFDTMFNIVRFGRLTMSEFNIMMNKIAPAAADAGMKLRDVGGAMAFLTTVMPSQRMVATGISRLIEALRHPDVAEGLHKFGVEVKNATTHQMRPFNEIINDIARTFPELKTGAKSAAEFFREISAAGRGGGRGVIFTQEGRRALSEIITHLDEFNDAQSRVEKNTNEFARANAAQMKSLGVQWGIFKNQVRALAIAVGQDAVPVFAQFGQAIQKLLNFWKSLDPDLRRTIVQIGLMTAAFSLLGGIFLAVLGGLNAFAAQIARLIPGMSKATGTMGAMRLVLGQLAAMAAIAIVFKVAIKGNATAVDLLEGAIAGAAAGFAIGGPLGALIGGITVPVIMKVVTTNVNLQDQLADELLEKTRRSGRMAREYGRYLAANIRAGTKDPMTRDEFEDFRRRMDSVDAVERNRFQTDRQQTAQSVKTHRDAVKKHKDLLGQYYKKLQEYDERVKNFNGRLKEWKANLIQSTKDAAKSAVDNLRNMYMQMQQQNEQAAGELFQGPWLTSETFDLAKEWGIEPRMQDLLKDLKDQNKEFARWRASLDAIMKKGLPTDFVDEIKKMPIEQGQPLLDAIMKAKPGQVNALIREWKTRQKQITSATKMDFKDEIERFRKAGGNMGAAIIDGFENAKVGLFFDRWIKTQFPDAINAAVTEATKRWRAENPRPVNRPGRRPMAPPKIPGSTRKNPAGIAHTGTRTHDTRGVTTIVHGDTITIQIPPGVGERGDYGVARRTAWELKNAKHNKLMRHRWPFAK